MRISILFEHIVYPRTTSEITYFYVQNLHYMQPYIHNMLSGSILFRCSILCLVAYCGSTLHQSLSFSLFPNERRSLISATVNEIYKKQNDHLLLYLYFFRVHFASLEVNLDEPKAYLTHMDESSNDRHSWKKSALSVAVLTACTLGQSYNCAFENN